MTFHVNCAYFEFWPPWMAFVRTWVLPVTLIISVFLDMGPLTWMTWLGVTTGQVHSTMQYAMYASKIQFQPKISFQISYCRIRIRIFSWPISVVSNVCIYWIYTLIWELPIKSSVDSTNAIWIYVFSFSKNLAPPLCSKT